MAELSQSMRIVPSGEWGQEDSVALSFVIMLYGGGSEWLKWLKWLKCSEERD